MLINLRVDGLDGLDFAYEDKVKDNSFAAGTLVAEKANAWEADLATATAREGNSQKC